MPDNDRTGSDDAAPIFVVGYQRSGTTLLQSLLGAHPNIAAPPETYFLFRIARLQAYYGDLADDSNLARVVHDALNPPIPLFADCGFSETEILDRVRRGPRTMRAVFTTILDDFARRQGKARWSEKTPGQTAGEVYKTFEHAKVVHIVRDPRDVIASSLRTPWTPPDAYGLAVAWRDFVRSTVAAGDRAGPERFLQVRYEDLTRRPRAVLEDIFAFLGEDFHDEVLTDPSRRRATIAETAAPWQTRALQEVTPATEGGWRSSLGFRDRAIVASVLGGEISRLGYERAEAGPRLAGRLLALPPRIRARRRFARLRGTMTDPQRHYEATQAYLREQAAIIAARTGD